MSLIVQKFGGSSVADAGKLLHISHIIKAAYEAGDDVIVVVSAQGNTTDRLIEKARELLADPPLRELDALLATGEQASAALTALALTAQGVPAVSLDGRQIPVRTDARHGDARIAEIGHARIETALRARRVAVCTGFQGTDNDGDVTTLGRGGSDYSAVALAAAFDAARCVIYTDVDGVYTADPRLCPSARRLESVSYEDMYALARAGAKVLYDKCVRLAQEKRVALEVRSCAPRSVGTRISAQGGSRRVTGVTKRGGEKGELAAVTLVGGAMPSLEIEKRAILALHDAQLSVRGVDAGERSLTLYVDPERSREALCILHDAVVKT